MNRFELILGAVCILSMIWMVFSKAYSRTKGLTMKCEYCGKEAVSLGLCVDHAGPGGQVVNLVDPQPVSVEFQGEGKPRTIRTSSFEQQLATLLNRHSKENGSNTPDFILAAYLSECLTNFNNILQRRAAWYGRIDHIMGSEPRPAVCVCGRPFVDGGPWHEGPCAKPFDHAEQIRKEAEERGEKWAAPEAGK